jgi:serine/threonine protein phosphatase PrpC
VSPLVTAAGSTDIGKIRKRNEDALMLVPGLGIAVVADGMGGHPGGDVASRVATDTSARVLSDAFGHRGSEQDFETCFLPAMSRAASEAHAEIQERGRAESTLRGMGTTLTAMILDSETGRWVIGHVGDSRAYRLRLGTLEQLTRDDTWIQQQIDLKLVEPEHARQSPFAHLLTQCVGLEQAPTPQVLTGQGEPGDVFLLCTDGLTGMLDEETLTQLLDTHLREGDPLSAATQALVDAAVEAGGRDNVTAALLRLD